MPYYEKKIISGDLLEIERYWTTDAGNRMPRSGNANETRQKQEDLNHQAAQKRLIRLLNANFSGKAGDVFITLTYKKSVEEEQAKKEVVNFIRRVKRYCVKNELPERKYINITEHQGKWHHHIIMNALPMETIIELWGRGRVTISILDKAYNFEDLGRYLLQAEKPSKDNPEIVNTKEERPKHARRWNSSLNLQQPVIEIREIKQSVVKKQPAAPKGYYLLPNWKMGTDCQGNLYMHFKCAKLEETPPKKKRRKRNVL